MRISDWSSDVCSSDLAAGVQSGPRIEIEFLARLTGKAEYIGRAAGFEHAADECAARRERDRRGDVDQAETIGSRAAFDPQLVIAGRQVEDRVARQIGAIGSAEIGREACSGRVCPFWSFRVVAGPFKKKNHNRKDTSI